MNLIIIAVYVGITLLICTMFGYSIYRYIRRLNYIKNFTAYVSVLEYHMDKAYDLVHKDKILAFSLEAFRIPDDEYESISHEYVKLVRKYIGPTLLEELVNLYGDEDTFIFILLDYFGRRYEDDEIRKTAMSNLTQEE